MIKEPKKNVIGKWLELLSNRWSVGNRRGYFLDGQSIETMLKWGQRHPPMEMTNMAMISWIHDIMAAATHRRQTPTRRWHIFHDHRRASIFASHDLAPPLKYLLAKGDGEGLAMDREMRKKVGLKMIEKWGRRWIWKCP